MAIGQPFNTQFKEGDVIYGGNIGRLDYIYSLPEDLVHRLRAEGPYIYLNHYNDSTFGAVPYEVWDKHRDFLKRQNIQNFPNTERDIRFNLKINKINASSNPQVRDALNAYYNALAGSRYAPLDAVKIDIVEAQAKGNASAGQRVFRRACKFGLHYVLEVLSGRTVHFALEIREGERMDFAEIVNKGRYSKGRGAFAAVPITTSELRCCYRNRLAWESTGRLKFYFNLREVAAPWVTDPEVWNIYEEHRIAKGKVERT